jgi:hypothetical protein
MVDILHFLSSAPFGPKTKQLPPATIQKSAQLALSEDIAAPSRDNKIALPGANIPTISL